MGHLTNNHEGSFDFPSGQASSAKPPVGRAPLPTSDDSHFEIISQAKRDRIKAEELIASLTETRDEDTSYISLANDEGDDQMRPGDFAAADPYVNTNENNDGELIFADTKYSNQPMEKNKAGSGMSGTVDSTQDAGNTPVAGNTPIAGARPGPSNTQPPQRSLGQNNPSASTNLSTPQRGNPEHAAEQGVRTVEQILSSIPGYETEIETETDSAAISKPTVEVTQASNPTKASASAPSEPSASTTATPTIQTPESFGVQGADPTQEGASQSLAQPCTSPLNCDGEALVPVSWFNQTEESLASDLGIETVEAGNPSDSTGVNFVSTSVDPLTGEEQFDVRDFSEMADAKLESIPNAFRDGDESVIEPTPNAAVATAAIATTGPTSTDNPEQERILRPEPQTGAAPKATPEFSSATSDSVSTADLSKLGADQAPAASTAGGTANLRSEPTGNGSKDTPSRVTTVTPVSSPLSSSASASGAGLAAAGAAGAGLLASSLASGSSSESSVGDGENQPAQTDAETAVMPKSKTSANPLSKKAPPAPAIGDDEIAAALEKCDEDTKPAPQPGVPTQFAEETFGESAPTVTIKPQAEAGQQTATEPTTETRAEVVEQQTATEPRAEVVAQQTATEPQAEVPPQTATEPDDTTFLVDEGDVVRIDGNDGFDFIDLTCFARSTADVRHDRIIVDDGDNPKFEVHYKNIPHALFADGITVELPPQVGLTS